MDYNKKIKSVISFCNGYSKADQLMYNTLNEKIYYNTFSDLSLKFEDLVYITLFGVNYDYIHESFATPGMSENEKIGKIVLWDDKGGGYPPEKLSEYLLNLNNYKHDPKIEDKIKYQIKLINKGLKKLKKIKK